MAPSGSWGELVAGIFVSAALSSGSAGGEASACSSGGGAGGISLADARVTGCEAVVLALAFFEEGCLVVRAIFIELIN